MSPKKETVRFLLNYSRALRIVRKGSMQFECIMN